MQQRQEQVLKLDHPLGWLPTMLLPEETDLAQYLPQQHPRGSSCALPAWEDLEPTSEAGIYSNDSTETNILWVEAEVSEKEKAATQSAVINWKQASNGKIESRVFHSDTTIRAEALNPTTLALLPLDCLPGTEAIDIQIDPCLPRRPLSQLFAAAANGGAYNRGNGGAYGRLAAWQSLGALAGATWDAGIEETADLANSCAWFSFNAKSMWFYDVAWDLGLVALRPGGRQLAVLAATDTD